MVKVLAASPRIRNREKAAFYQHKLFLKISINLIWEFRYIIKFYGKNIYCKTIILQLKINLKQQQKYQANINYNNNFVLEKDWVNRHPSKSAVYLNTSTVC